MNNLFIINCLSTINLNFCIMTRNNERFFWSFFLSKKASYNKRGIFVLKSYLIDKKEDRMKKYF